MKREAGKGSKSRPFSISQNAYRNNWDRTFNNSGAPVRLENPLNHEVWYCNNYNDTYTVEGVDYVRVYKQDAPERTNLMRKSALQRI